MKRSAEEIVRQLAELKLSYEGDICGGYILKDNLIKQGREWVADNPLAATDLQRET